jgi:hypothetical protein
MPERAGAIAWARSLMGRIKAPIDKFKQKSDKLNPVRFMTVATQYVKLAKDLDKEYEQEIFNTWTSRNSTRAL